MPKRKQENIKYYAPAWTGTIETSEFKRNVQNFIQSIPPEVDDYRGIDLSSKFDDLKILSGTALCEDKIQKALKQWKKRKLNPNNKMTHIQFAQSLKMPSLPKCEKIWKNLRDRRSAHAEKQSKIETNSWTYLRKTYRKEKIKQEKGELIVHQKLMLYHICIFNSIHSTQAGRLMKEMIFLDNQTLYTLARQVICLAKHKVSRGFFVLNGVIYCDRESDCADFIKKSHRNFRENQRDPTNDCYVIKPMRKTLISSLRVQLGKPFYFVHGNCQHQIVFTHIRISKLDHFNVKEYPLPVYEQLKRRQKCCVCVDHTATKVTYNDMHATQSPCFWCLQCFQAFHYNNDGTKQYEEFEEADYFFD